MVPPCELPFRDLEAWKERTFLCSRGNHAGYGCNLTVSPHYLILQDLYVCIVVSALASINVVNLHWARLVLGWVTVCRQVNHLRM